MPEIAITKSDRQQVEDLLKFIRIGMQEMSDSAKQVLAMELVRFLKPQIDQLKARK